MALNIEKVFNEGLERHDTNGIISLHNQIFSLFKLYNYSDAVWINLWNETWHFFGIFGKVHVPEYVKITELLIENVTNSKLETDL